MSMQTYAQRLQHPRIPSIAGQMLDLTGLTLLDTSVKLADVFTAYYQLTPEQRTHATQLVVYTDELHITKEMPRIKGNLHLHLVARTITCDDGAQLLLQPPPKHSQYGRITLYTQSIIGTLTIGREKSVGSLLQLTDMQGALGLAISLQDDQLTQRPLHECEEEFTWESPARQLLTLEFQLAADFFTSQPEIASSMLTWIIAMTRESVDAQDLYLQSASLLTRLGFMHTTVRFIPYLTQIAYEKEAVALLASVREHQNLFDRFSDGTQQVQARKAAAELMLQRDEDMNQRYHTLTQQAHKDVEMAQQDAQATQERFTQCQGDIEVMRTRFQYSQERWVEAQYWDAVKQMAFAIGSFGIAIASTAVGFGGAGATQAVQQGANAVQMAQQVAQQGSTMVALLKKMAEALDALWQVGEKVETMVSSITTLLSITQASASGMPEMPLSLVPTDFKPISGQAEWDAFQSSTAALLHPAIQKEIGYALEYKTALDMLVIYGKATMSSQNVLMKAAQECTQLILQEQLSRSHTTRFRTYIRTLSNEMTINQALMQQISLQELRAKIWLFLALQHLTWAYAYEALTDSTVTPTINKTSQQFEDDIATIVRKTTEARTKFVPYPQPIFLDHVLISDADPLYRGIVARLQNERQALVTIDLSSAYFQKWDRVRLTTMRCVLQGVDLPRGKEMTVMMKSSGLHLDRWKQHTYQFVTSPLELHFRYKHTGHIIATEKRVEDDVLGRQYAISMDGQVAEEFRGSYYQPTPFTQWSLEVGGDEIALSGLTSIKLSFQGSAISSRD